MYTLFYRSHDHASKAWSKRGSFVRYQGQLCFVTVWPKFKLSLAYVVRWRMGWSFFTPPPTLQRTASGARPYNVRLGALRSQSTSIKPPRRDPAVSNLLNQFHVLECCLRTIYKSDRMSPFVSYPRWAFSCRQNRDEQQRRPISFYIPSPASPLGSPPRRV